MHQFDRLIKKGHVKNHPLFVGRDDRIKAMREAMSKVSETTPLDLVDIFSQAKQIGIKAGDRSINAYIQQAAIAAQQALDVLHWPLPPRIEYNNARKVRYARHDDSQVVDAEILFNVKIATVSGLKREATLPVHIAAGQIVPPSTLFFEDRMHLLAQSTVDSIVRRNTSYYMPPLRRQFSPPLRGQDLDTAVEARNLIGWQARETQPRQRLTRTFANKRAGEGVSEEDLYDYEWSNEETMKMYERLSSDPKTKAAITSLAEGSSREKLAEEMANNFVDLAYDMFPGEEGEEINWDELAWEFLRGGPRGAHRRAQDLAGDRKSVEAGDEDAASYIGKKVCGVDGPGFTAQNPAWIGTIMDIRENKRWGNSFMITVDDDEEPYAGPVFADKIYYWGGYGGAQTGIGIYFYEGREARRSAQAAPSFSPFDTEKEPVTVYLFTYQGDVAYSFEYEGMPHSGNASDFGGEDIPWDVPLTFEPDESVQSLLKDDQSLLRDLSSPLSTEEAESLLYMLHKRVAKRLAAMWRKAQEAAAAPLEGEVTDASQVDPSGTYSIWEAVANGSWLLIDTVNGDAFGGMGGREEYIGSPGHKVMPAGMDPNMGGEENVYLGAKAARRQAEEYYRPGPLPGGLPASHEMMQDQENYTRKRQRDEFKEDMRREREWQKSQGEPEKGSQDEGLSPEARRSSMKRKAQDTVMRNPNYKQPGVDPTALTQVSNGPDPSGKGVQYGEASDATAEVSRQILRQPSIMQALEGVVEIPYIDDQVKYVYDAVSPLMATMNVDPSVIDWYDLTSELVNYVGYGVQEVAARKRVAHIVAKHLAKGLPKKHGYFEDDESVAAEIAWYAMDRPMYESVAKNMRKFMDKGNYDHASAVTGWLHLIDRASSEYAKEFGDGGTGRDYFPSDIRQMAAEMLATRWENEQAGEQGFEAPVEEISPTARTAQQKDEEFKLKNFMPPGYDLVLGDMLEAEEKGLDTFPRAYAHIERNYILRRLSTCSKDKWFQLLVNDGFVITPYSVNRGRPGKGKYAAKSE